MSGEDNPLSWIKSSSWVLIAGGFFLTALSPGLGTFCCLFGIFGLVAGSIASSGSAVSSDGKMVLKQDSSGEWKWMTQGAENVQASAADYNNPSNQILSRVIKQVRDGKPLEQLEQSELDVLSSAYGFDSGSRTQKIEALHNSDIAKKGLKLGAIAAAGGIAGVATSRIIQSSREKAVARAEELREQGRQKLQENIDQGKYEINSRIPANESGETATEVAHNVVLDQISKQIKERNLTPQILMEVADFNKDGKLDATEIAGAMTAATGFAVPAFIVTDAIKQFDSNGDGKLDENELNQMWVHLGFELESEGEYSDDEIDNVLEEVELDDSIDDVEHVDSQQDESATLQAEEDARLQAEEDARLHAEEEARIHQENEAQSVEEIQSSEGDLSEGIDTDLERFIVQMEEAKFSSERRTLMETQTSEFLVNLKIQKMERTLIGDPVYRSGQSVHGLIDGGPYVGVIKIPVAFDEKILSHKEGDEITVWAKLVDFSPSLKRPVLESSEMI
ncbi:MAG: hypothetical protein H2066_02180 [Candidatus Poseidoniales archaeon]|nr:hypothetical protein [Candidatus Poseidoniales archaeon]